MNVDQDCVVERTTHGGAFIHFTTAVLACALILAAPAALGGAPHEERIVVNRTLDRTAIVHLQRWVSSGHEAWCKDAQMVASYQIGRIAPDFSGEKDELRALPLEIQSTSATKIVFRWTPLDGRATYRVTVERFAWLLPLAGQRNAIVWVPTRTEIVAHE
jgi:hypothetical protein